MFRIIYCPICEDKIRKYGDLAYEVYRRICESPLFYGGIFKFSLEKYKLSQIIKFLEMKGYVVTTEMDRIYLYAKTLGKYFFEEGKYLFCTDVEAHYKNFVDDNNEFE